tara:strand:- start:294 stop:422 length:129 start_codon:yes stop_codon:yes gene_type:complete
MFNKILIANRGDQLACQLKAKPNCLATHFVRGGEFDTENHDV